MNINSVGLGTKKIFSSVQYLVSIQEGKSPSVLKGLRCGGVTSLLKSGIASTSQEKNCAYQIARASQVSLTKYCLPSTMYFLQEIPYVSFFVAVQCINILKIFQNLNACTRAVPPTPINTPVLITPPHSKKSQ